jgi:hypothetical protein
MRTPLIAIVFLTFGGAVWAQPAHEGSVALEFCFQSARGADSICTDPENNAVQRLECLQKAHTKLLECLEHIPPEATAGSAIVGTSIAPEMPAATASPESPTASILPDKQAAAVLPDKSTVALAPSVPAAAGPPDIPAADVSPAPPARAVAVPAKSRDTSWIISETTSPVDYSPVITAAVRLPFSVRHAPNTFAIRCRGRHAELLVRTEGTWRASRAGQVQVDYQINEQPTVRLPWMVSADGKTASYKDDAVALLHSLPDGARLKIDVVDGPGPSHEATFQLGGLDAVREKLVVACKWAPAATKVSSEKR